MALSCLVCGSAEIEEALDLGHHPVASFFLSTRSEEVEAHRIALAQCFNCATIQLSDPVPHHALVPPYDWLVAREPEEHLDRVVNRLSELPGIGSESVIGGLTYKDDTTIDRFRAMGKHSTWRLNLTEDFGITRPGEGNEVVQKLTTQERMSAVAQRHGQADILIVRHIIEHAEDMPAFVRGLAELVKPGGYAMVEVPDCAASLALFDYCMIWEEHSVYLTPETFAPLLSLGGFELVSLETYSRPFENSLVQIAKKSGSPGPLQVKDDALSQVGLLKEYATAHSSAKQLLRKNLTTALEGDGKVALFGAGHLACAFVDYMGVGDLIAFVADDTPQKQGKLLPGSKLPIVPSSELVKQPITLCLLALSIGNEDSVIGKNRKFVENGGRFRSIFRASPRSIFGDGMAMG